jgi:hypothetical protein
MASPELKVRVLADTKKFQSQMKMVSAKVKQVGKGVSSMGKKMSVASGAIAAFGATSLKAFNEQAQAESRLRAQLEANGREVNGLFEDYANFASSLQKITTVGDESTLQLLQVAESMGLSGEQAKRSAKNAIAVSKAFGINEQSAIRYTAALEQGNATMLSRYIPALREIDDDSAKVAKAQELLGNMFSTATAEAQSGLGPLQQMKNTFGDLQEQLGKVIADAINPLATRLKSFFELVQAQSPETKKKIVIVAGAIAALGPALVVVGTAIAGVGMAIGLLTSPVTLAVVAVGALVGAFFYLRDNWQAVTERLSDPNWWRNGILELIKILNKYNPYNLLLKAGVKGINALVKKFSKFINKVATMFTKLKGQIMEKLGGIASKAGDLVANVPGLKGAGKAVKEFGKNATEVGQQAKEAAEKGLDITSDFKLEIETPFDFIADKAEELKGTQKEYNTEFKTFTDYLGDAKQKMKDLMGFSSGVQAPEVDPTQRQQLGATGFGGGEEDGFGDVSSDALVQQQDVELVPQMTLEMQALQQITGLARQAFMQLGQAVANSLTQAIMQGKKFGDVLKNLLKQLASKALQKFLTIALTGGAGGALGKIGGGIFGEGGGLFGKIGGALFGGAKMATGGIVPRGFPNDTYPALLTSGEMVVPKPHALPSMGGAVEVFGEFRVRGSDLVTAISNTNNRTLR